MIRVAGIRFKKAGKVYYFAPGGFAVEKGMGVIVETARGLEYGTIADDIDTQQYLDNLKKKEHDL